MKMNYAKLIFLLVLVFIPFGLPRSRVQAEHPIAQSKAVFTEFESYLETVRQTLKIPGMSAAVLQDQELVWAGGFGYADLENGVPATPDTPYGLASVTKPVAAVVLMQLVEESLIDLDAPLRQYGVNLLREDVTVRHLLTHTSEGIPGQEHHYNGSRYGYLAGVIQGASGKTFAQLLSERILQPLEMESTALNPVHSWGGASLSPWMDFQIALGWGEAFRQYPGVYAQLAKPYQLDELYNPIPGMWHLYHNTAAGMISSVKDLAKFDQALDAGVLLGDEAMAEMLAPAVSTYGNRPDLNYGLGWYVQEFEGLQMLWHSGRWPPSASALYLKIPSEGLTFIILANTDNLTVPFKSIGHGDVSKSLLALSFFRYFIYPGIFRADLPNIDWSATEGPIVRQLVEIQSEPARRYLERELWSYRQAYASVGREDQVSKLWRVSQRAFPDSTMRKDEIFTHTVGKLPVIPESLSASAFVVLSRGVLIWLLLVLTSLVWIGVILLRSSEPTGFWYLWLLGTIFLGPVALLVYRGFQQQSRGGISSRSRALIISTFLAGCHTLGWGLGLTILMRSGGTPHPLRTLGLTYLTPVLAALVLFHVPAAFSWGKTYFLHRLPGTLLTAFIANNIGYAVMFPLTMFLNERVLTTIPGTLSPFFLGMLSVLSLANLLGQYPLRIWMIRRGLAIWHPTRADKFVWNEVPKLGSGWRVVALSVIILITSLVITISQLA